MKLSLAVLAIVVVVELAWLIGMDRYVEQSSVSIESTELSHNPWPTPGGQTDIAGARGKTPSTVGTAPDGTAGDRRTTF